MKIVADCTVVTWAISNPRILLHSFAVDKKKKWGKKLLFAHLLCGFLKPLCGNNQDSC